MNIQEETDKKYYDCLLKTRPAIIEKMVRRRKVYGPVYHELIRAMYSPKDDRALISMIQGAARHVCREDSDPASPAESLRRGFSEALAGDIRPIEDLQWGDEEDSE